MGNSCSCWTVGLPEDDAVSNPPKYSTADVVSSPEESDEGETSDEETADDLPDLPKSYLNKGGRHSVSAEAFGDWNKRDKQFVPPVFAKSLQQKQRIRNTVNESFMFSCLDEAALNAAIDAFEEKVVKAGDVIINQGDDGETLYLIESGVFEARKKTPDHALPRRVATMSPGEAFGELALLYNTPRAASVVASTHGTLWMLGRDSFNHIVKDAARQKRELHENLLKDVEILKDMDPYERSKLADALKTVTFEDGAVVIREGEPGNIFYMIEEGEAQAIKQNQVVMDYKRGGHFGELALIKDQARAATIIARGKLVCAAMDRRSFKRLLGPVEKILLRNAERYKQVKAQVS